MIKLDAHLIAHTTPSTPDALTVKGDGFRISVLTDRLFRIETDPAGRFNDSATQIVWNRNFSSAPYNVAVTDKSVTVTTDKASILYDKVTKRAEYVIFNDGRKVKCDNKGNMKGTARTLDMSCGRFQFLPGTIGKKFWQAYVVMDDGIVSKTGVALLKDDSLYLGEDGLVKPNDKGRTDTYVFAYDKDYSAALADFYRLTGKTPVVPRFALGNWWSRYKAYTQEEYTGLMQRFIDEDIPFTVATVDMDWHWVKLAEAFGEEYGQKKLLSVQGAGWTGYSWNKKLFPDYKQFLKELKAMGYHVTLNLHPAQGVRPFEDMYKDMCYELGLDPDKKQPIPFDITSTAFINAYFKVLHKPYEKDGVDFWWIDWQQGTKTAVEGLDPLWALNHYHYLDSQKTPDGGKKAGLILSRYSGPGSHRYPLGFSGDTAASWKTLKFQPYFTANAANIGYGWWSHDIGGHYMGKKDDEMYLRWIQLGVFSPVNRLHSTSNELQGKEPWKCNKSVDMHIRRYLKLRHAMIPYLFTENYKSSVNGSVICRPMYYDYPDCEGAYAIKNEYMFGSELLVCPITGPVNKKTGLAGQKVWLPEGKWTDVFTGISYKGGRTVEMFRDMADIPVLAKEGAIIPLSLNKGNDASNPVNMELWLYSGSNSYTLYEEKDSGEGVQTAFNMVKADDMLLFEIINGDTDIAERNFRLCFKDVVSASCAVMINDEEVYCGRIEKDVPIQLSGIKANDKVLVRLNDIEYKTNPTLKEYAVEILSKLQGRNIPKQIKYRAVENSADFAKAIRRSRFPSQAKRAALEIEE